MQYKIENEQGQILMGSLVFGRIVAEVVNQFKGKVWITNSRGKIARTVQKAGKSDAIKNIEVIFGKEGLDIRVFITLLFGTSIGNTTNELISLIRATIKEQTSIEVNSVAIVVTGMLPIKGKVKTKNIKK